MQFSRRSAIRSYLLDSVGGEGDEAREMAPYHEDYSNLLAEKAMLQVSRVLELINAVLQDTPEQDPDRFTFEFLARALEASLVRIQILIHKKRTDINIVCQYVP